MCCPNFPDPLAIVDLLFIIIGTVHKAFAKLVCVVFILEMTSLMGAVGTAITINVVSAEWRVPHAI